MNFLSYLVYKQLGEGELKPTKVSLQLADRSVKFPKGEIENMLFKFSEFIFLLDFIILDTEPIKNPRGHISVILGRPFLTTSNTLSAIIAVY